MPQRWKDCLEGHGEVDLSQARILSEHQYLWSNNSIASRLTGFFASKVMTSRMQHLSVKDYVPPFNDPQFSGELYQLDEPVLDMQSVIEALRQQFEAFIFQFNVDEISRRKDNGAAQSDPSYTLTAVRQNITIIARRLILTAGAGNEKLLASLNFKQPEMQLRPLLMPMLKAKASLLPKMYAHCLGASTLPKMTITAYHLSADGHANADDNSNNKNNEDQVVWYLGGEIAEKGVNRSIEDQVVAARQELQRLMPWIDFSQCQWSALAVDRAEPKMSDGSRPVEPAVFRQHNVITAWPVKLAMTPLMVDKILQELEQLDPVPEKVTKATAGSQQVLLPAEVLAGMTRAETTQFPWEKVQNWL